jgi:hypothetical protein
LADDGFDAYLNNATTPFLSHSGANGSNQVTSGSVSLGFTSPYLLRIVVHNGMASPTGLDVRGTLTAHMTPCRTYSRNGKGAPSP